MKPVFCQKAVVTLQNVHVLQPYNLPHVTHGPSKDCYLRVERCEGVVMLDYYRWDTHELKESFHYTALHVVSVQYLFLLSPEQLFNPA